LSFAAIELSYDKDFVRYRASVEGGVQESFSATETFQ